MSIDEGPWFPLSLLTNPSEGLVEAVAREVTNLLAADKWENISETARNVFREDAERHIRAIAEHLRVAT